MADRDNTDLAIMAPAERWLPYPKRPAYLISDCGRVRGPHGGFVKLRAGTTRGGYLRFAYLEGAKQINVSIHSAVLAAFVGPRPDGMHVAHLDGNVTNNRLENLIYATPKENHAHRVMHGTDTKGSRNGRAKMTEEVALAIYAQPEVLSDDLAIRYGVSRESVQHVRYGHTWTHVTGAVVRGIRKNVSSPKWRRPSAQDRSES